MRFLTGVDISITYALICALILVVTYLVNITYMSVFYHRTFTHGSLVLRPWFRKFVIMSGPWVTGMDIKAWSCMHRIHHKYSDKRRDPHSPSNSSILYVIVAQVQYYARVMQQLLKGRRPYAPIVADLDFPVVWFQRMQLWWVPYLVHIAIGVGIALTFNAWLAGAAFIMGCMSHPIQGWIINSFGHAVGYRNFDRDDDSRNNMPAALFILGEGFQNNHHQYPASARFSAKPWEIDFGYVICRVLEFFRVARISQEGLIPKGV